MSTLEEIMGYFKSDIVDEDNNKVLISGFFINALFQKTSDVFERITGEPFNSKIGYTLWDGNVYHRNTHCIDCTLFLYRVSEPVKIKWYMSDGTVIDPLDNSPFDVDKFIVEFVDLDELKIKMIAKREYRVMQDFVNDFINKNGKNTLSETFVKVLLEKTAIKLQALFNIDILKNPKNFFFNSRTTDFYNNYDNLYHYDNSNKLYTHFYFKDGSEEFEISWKSKSGKNIKPSDEVIDIKDIEMNFILDEQSYATIRRALSYRDKLPFRTKKLNYKFELEDTATHFYIVVASKYDDLVQMKKIGIFIDKVFDDFNVLSESKKRKNGVVHSHGVFEISNTLLVNYVDIGSAKPSVIKQILEGLNDFDNIESVKITTNWE